MKRIFGLLTLTSSTLNLQSFQLEEATINSHISVSIHTRHRYIKLDLQSSLPLQAAHFRPKRGAGTATPCPRPWPCTRQPPFAAVANAIQWLLGRTGGQAAGSPPCLQRLLVRMPFPVPSVSLCRA